MICQTVRPLNLISSPEQLSPSGESGSVNRNEGEDLLGRQRVYSAMAVSIGRLRPRMRANGITGPQQCHSTYGA